MNMLLKVFLGGGVKGIHGVVVLGASATKGNNGVTGTLRRPTGLLICRPDVPRLLIDDELEVEPPYALNVFLRYCLC